MKWRVTVEMCLQQVKDVLLLVLLSCRLCRVGRLRSKQCARALVLGHLGHRHLLLSCSVARLARRSSPEIVKVERRVGRGCGTRGGGRGRSLRSLRWRHDATGSGFRGGWCRVEKVKRGSLRLDSWSSSRFGGSSRRRSLEVIKVVTECVVSVGATRRGLSGWSRSC